MKPDYAISRLTFRVSESSGVPRDCNRGIHRHDACGVRFINLPVVEDDDHWAVPDGHWHEFRQLLGGHPGRRSQCSRGTVTAGVLGAATVESGRACVFYGPSAPKPPDPNVAQPDSVRVVVVKGPDASRWYNDYKSKVTAAPVTGYGDQAYYDGFASFNILDGINYLRVAVIPAVGSPSLSNEQNLAAAILPKS